MGAKQRMLQFQHLKFKKNPANLTVYYNEQVELTLYWPVTILYISSRSKYLIITMKTKCGLINIVIRRKAPHFNDCFYLFY